jgi:aminopeptidase N
MLRNELGDEVFFNTIRTYYATYKNSNADTEDFKKVVATVSGKNVDQFFNQWLYGMGQPKLEGKWQYNKKVLTIEVNQIQKEEFRFPLEVALVYDDKTVLKQLTFDSTTVSLSLEAEKPNQIILDPNTKLLFEGESVLNFIK